MSSTTPSRSWERAAIWWRSLRDSSFGVAGNRATGRLARGRRRLLTAPRLAWRPLGGLLGPAVGDASQSLGALALSATTSLITGLTLAAFTDTLEQFPGLLLFIPAAIGLRGNVFGPLGSRLSTAIRTGTFFWSRRPESLLGQNVIGAMMSSLLAAVGVATVAEVVALALAGRGVDVIGWADFVVVSVVGGAMASVVVLAITLGLAVASARFGWDLDNVTAPLVSASGDFVTLPALVLATGLIRREWFTRSLALVLVVLVLAAAVVVFRSRLTDARRVVIESVPILLVAGTLSLFAGIVLERSIDRFLTFSVLVVLLPGYLATGGALGGILANRLSTKVHLGLVKPARSSARAKPATTSASCTGWPYRSSLCSPCWRARSASWPERPHRASISLIGGRRDRRFAGHHVCLRGRLLRHTASWSGSGSIPTTTAFRWSAPVWTVVGSITLIVALLVWGIA